MIGKIKKNGVYITKHKNWSTKKVFSNGWLMRKYMYVPHEIKFSHKMVNDINQNFCGGWGMTGLDTSNMATLKRVLDGDKPMCVIFDKGDFDKYIQLIDKELFDYKVIEPNKGGYSSIAVASNKKLSNVFDLEILKSDYEMCGIEIDIEEVEDKYFRDFFDGWDVKDIQMWITGLILGYPIENTISIYRQ